MSMFVEEHVNVLNVVHLEQNSTMLLQGITVPAA